MSVIKSGAHIQILPNSNNKHILYNAYDIEASSSFEISNEVLQSIYEIAYYPILFTKTGERM